MNKRLLLTLWTVLMAVTAWGDAPDIIYNQPEGTLRIYERQCVCIEETNEGEIVSSSQSGKLNIVFGTDGAVYIQGLVSKDISNSWVKGTLSADGRTVTIPTDQYVDYTRTFDMAYQLKMLYYDADAEYYFPDMETTEVTLTIDGNTMTMNGTSKEHPLGLIIRTFGNPQGSAIGQTFDYLNYQWIGYADYATVYTLDANQPQQPVKAIETTTYYMTTAENDGANFSSFARTVGIGFDGDEIWLQGLCKYLPEAWIRGVRSGETCTIASGQFLGAYADAPLYLLGAGPDKRNQEITLKDDIVLTIDGSRISTQDYLFLSISATNIEYVNYYMGVTLDTEAETTITPPDGLTTEKYTMSYKASATDTKTQSLRIDVGLDGEDIYIKGIWDGLPEAWVKGRVSGNTVTLDGGQYLGIYQDTEFDKYAMYLTVFNSVTGAMIPQVTFDYDALTRTLSAASAPLSIGINKTGYLSVQDYYAPVLTPEEPAGISLTSNDSPSTANYYDLQGRKADKATKGLLIMKSADGKTVKVLKR